MPDIFGPSQAALEHRYARTTSRFAEIDGTRVHYLDEAARHQTAVILLSAQWSHFVMWDGWLPHLTDRYRVIVVDLPGHGLTAPFADGDYSMEHYTRLAAGLIDHVAPARFVVVGTSFSGPIAFRIAAQRDPRLAALILANASGVPRQKSEAGGPSPGDPPPQWLYRTLLPHYRFEGFMRWKLGTLVLDPARITPDVVEAYTDMNNRRGRLEESQARAKAYSSADTERLLGEVRVPTLIQWGTHSTYLAAREAEQMREWMVNTAAEVVIYRGVGHLIALDAPEATARDARKFLERVMRDESGESDENEGQ
jgi:pimeloyl-ACP methyl ester carboxylesterase